LHGRPYGAEIVKAPPGAKASTVEIRSGSILVSLVPRDRRSPRRVLEQWYRQQAHELVGAFVAKINEKLRYRVNRIFIRDQKSKWGACSSQRNLSFNWRLVMAPLDVIRYVVIHELCHLEEFNHTRRFWSLVQRECPDYARHREWLRSRGPLLGMLPESLSLVPTEPVPVQVG
jgi:hypothetical protein